MHVMPNQAFPLTAPAVRDPVPNVLGKRSILDASWDLPKTVSSQKIAVFMKDVPPQGVELLAPGKLKHSKGMVGPADGRADSWFTHEHISERQRSREE